MIQQTTLLALDAPQSGQGQVASEERPTVATAPLINDTDEPEQTPPHVEILNAVDADPSCVLLGRYTVEQLVEAIQVDIADHDHNPDTEAGRKGITSDAFTVRKRKSAIDKKRLEMTAEWRRLTAETNETGKAITEKLEALAVEIRAPVTKWEEAEKARKAEADRIIATLEAAKLIRFGETSATVQTRLDEIRGMNLNDEVLGARLEMAEDAKRDAVGILQQAVTDLAAQEAQAAELERLRREKAEADARAEQAEAQRIAEQQRQEREKAEQERIAKAAAEAAERARVEAEQAAERKRQEEAAAARAAEEERQRQAQAEIDAANRRAAEAEAAAQAERDRIAAEQKAREEAEAAAAEAQRQREADLAHRQKVIDTAVDALAGDNGIPGLTRKLATSIIHAIDAGKVPAVSIKF